MFYFFYVCIGELEFISILFRDKIFFRSLDGGNCRRRWGVLDIWGFVNGSM